ncbi:MAG: ABC transporter ATP-binding protein [Candidatus Melainabacteria bacterium]|nr:ABC transporter ATP-binding protein [Candidatus Melainabacteria bacterium]MBI3308045.1 ABC transporter ATP-binding protein [Candidatus Melainabacteria bacterium]
MKILEIQDLEVSFNDQKAVDSVSLYLNEGEIVGLVGESGCGKSLTALATLGMSHPSSKVQGKIFYKDLELLALNEKDKRKIRGNKISLIPQDPLSALNPVYTIGDQIAEVLEVHKGLTKKESMNKAALTLESVQFPAAFKRLTDYPHQFSGGMRQRVLIAMALVTEPDVIIADEPTTALDVTIQLQILEIMKELRRRGKAILLITHDLGVVAEVCDRVYVMYLGKIVESATAKEILTNPKHPYTIGLLNSLPVEGKESLTPIPGQPPGIHAIPTGCAFHTRCPYVFDRCKTEIPELYDIKTSVEHKSRCFLEIKD